MRRSTLVTSARSDGQRERREVLAIALLLVWLVVMPETFRFWGRVSLGIATGLVGAWAIWRLARSPADGVHWASVIGWCALLAYTLSVMFAVDPRFALEASIVPLVGIGLLVAFAAASPTSRSAALGVVTAGAVLALLTIIDWTGQVVNWVETIQAVDPRIGWLEAFPVAPPRATPSPHIHPNYAVALLYLTGAVTAAVTKIDGYRVLAWPALGLTALAMLATGSRGGLLAGMLSVGVVLALVHGRSDRSRKVVRRVLVSGATVGGGVFLLIFMSGYRPSFIFRSTLTDRVPVMEAGLEMFKARPWLGNGPGSFRPMFPLFAPDLYPGVDARLVWSNAHNGYVQFLLELGILGTLLLVVAGGLLVTVARNFTRDRQGAQRALVLGLLGGLGALLLHSPVDTVFEGHPVMYVGAIAGLALGGLHMKIDPPNRAGVWALALIPVMIVPTLIVSTAGAQLSYLKGRDAAIGFRWADAEAAFAAAYEADPLPVYAQALNYARIEGGDADLERSIRVEGWPEPVTIPLNLAKTSGEVDKARLLAEAEPSIAGDEVAMIEWASLQLELGNTEEAAALLTEVLQINPWLSSSPFLSELGVSLRESVLTSAFMSDPCGVGDEWILSEAATADQIELIVDQCDPTTDAALTARAKTGEAIQVLIAAESTIDRSPDSAVMRRMAGIAAIESGEVDKARNHLVIGALLGDFYSGWLLSSTYDRTELPHSIERLADELSVGYSPVLIGAAPIPVYRFGAVSMQMDGRRESLPSPLSHGMWQQAVTRLHSSLKEVQDEPYP